MLEVGWVTFAKVARRIGQAARPAYRSQRSKHRCTQPQLLAMLCLRRDEDWTFRATAARAAEPRERRAVLGLDHAPDPTALYRFRRRLEETVLRQIVSAELRTFFRPTTCGEHTLVVRAGHAAAPHDTGAVRVQVTINHADHVDDLIGKATALGLPPAEEVSLVSKVRVAKKAFAPHFPRVAVNRLTGFIGAVEVQRGTTLTDQQADRLIGQAKVILSCV